MTPRYKNNNRTQLMGETRQRLIKAAIDEFAREGYEGASINRITQAAGVAAGTIYNYFPGKNELMMAILSEIGAAHCAYIAEQIRQVDDLVQRVERLLEVCFAFVRENPHQARVLFAMMQGTNVAFRQHLSQIYQPMFQLIQDEILIPGMEQGIFQSLNPVNTTMMVMTFYLGIGSTADENGETPLDFNEAAAFVLRALGAKSTNKE